MSSYLKAWRQWSSDCLPYALEDDLEVLGSERSVERIVTTKSWQEAHSGSDFGAAGDSRLHLGLLPVPFVGDVRKASVYILMLNPGFGPADYFGEFEVPAYREALLANLKQEPTKGAVPFFCLDPQFAWSGGFRYWNGKLQGVIGELAGRWDCSFAEARARLGSELAAIELFPYHSSTFEDGDRWLKRLPSVQMAREFVDEVVMPRVRSGEAIGIVTRQVKLWGVEDEPGVVLYSAGQARSAHLTPQSPGGRAILEHLAGR